jgi:hypothetical protein
MAQSQLIDGQEMYTPALVRARLRDGGGFHARSFTTNALLWVTAIDGDVATVQYSMDVLKFKMRVSKLKSL